MYTPLDLHGHYGGPDAAGAWFPFVGLSMFLLVLLLAAALTAYLWRSGRLTGLVRLARPGPEAEAKRVLAERFARSDLSSEEFMERASILNWTPGSEAWPAGRRRGVKR